MLTFHLFFRLKVKPMLLPRYSHSSHIVKENLLLLIGGVSFPSYSQLMSSTEALREHIAIVDLSTSTLCSIINFPATYLGHPVHVHCHTSVLVETEEGENDILVIGGGSNCFSFGTGFTLSPLQFRLRLHEREELQ